MLQQPRCVNSRGGLKATVYQQPPCFNNYVASTTAPTTALEADPTDALAAALDGTVLIGGPDGSQH